MILPAGLFIVLISEPIFNFKFFTSPVYSPQIFFSNYFFKNIFFVTFIFEIYKRADMGVSLSLNFPCPGMAFVIQNNTGGIEKKRDVGYNITAMDEIKKIHDKFFKNVFKNEENTRALLRSCLPPTLNEAIDYTCLSIDPTNYISPQFAEGYSDIVAKTRIRTREKGFRLLDLYILVEHKSYLDAAIFIQLLGYMILMWQEDIKNKVPLRLIIPVVFYHGESKWTIPLSFLDQFDVDEEVKKYLLDFRYILFDTSEIDLWAEKNRDLKENLYFFTSMVMMKQTFNENLEEIKRMFRLWVEKEFHRNPEVMQFVLTYLAQTANIDRDTLEEMLNESKLDGGAIMETLYQKIENEGIQKGIQKGKQEGIQEGIQEGKQEVVLNAFEKGLPEDTIASITGFSMKEIRKMQKVWFSTKKSQTTH